MVAISHYQMVVLRFMLDGEPQQWIAPVDMVRKYMAAFSGRRRLVIPLEISKTHSRELKLAFIQRNQQYLTGVSGFSTPTQYLLYQSAIPLTKTSAERLIDTLKKKKYWRQAQSHDNSDAALYRL